MSSEAGKILVAGVGYRNLRDMSLGPVLIDRLQRESWPSQVEIEDLSYGPIGIMHSLAERPPYARMVLIAGVKRDRRPGEVYRYRWNRQLPSKEEIQARVVEAATGVIDLDNLLIVATYFGRLPDDVNVIEVEAVDESWGEALTSTVENAIPRVIDEIRSLIG